MARQKGIAAQEREALITAIELIGGVQATAERLGVRRQAVYKWLHGTLPFRRVEQLEAACGKRVKRHELCRDIDVYLQREQERMEVWENE